VISSEIKGNTQEREKQRKLTVHTERAFPLNAIQDKQYLKHPKKQTAKAPAALNNIYPYNCR
jgi:hypothetical protein